MRSNSIPTAYIVNTKGYVVWMGHAMSAGPAVEACLIEDTPYCTGCLRLSHGNMQNIYHCLDCNLDVCVQCVCVYVGVCVCVATL